MTENRIAIIDLDSVCFSIGQGNKVLDESGIPKKDESGKFIYIEKNDEELYESADFFMTDILSSCKATHYIAYIKGKGNYRYAIKADYKANRPKSSPTWWKAVKEYLIEKWGAIEVNNIECDDAVNITRKAIKNSFIVAIDQDLLELEGIAFNWRKKEWKETGEEQAHCKLWTDCIAGQSSDGVKALPGKGVRYAEKIFERDAGVPLPAIVLMEYINIFGEEDGIREFYQTYSVLKIKDKWEGFVVPDLIEYNNVNEFKG